MWDGWYQGDKHRALDPTSDAHRPEALCVHRACLSALLVALGVVVAQGILVINVVANISITSSLLFWYGVLAVLAARHDRAAAADMAGAVWAEHAKAADNAAGAEQAEATIATAGLAAATDDGSTAITTAADAPAAAGTPQHEGSSRSNTTTPSTSTTIATITIPVNRGGLVGSISAMDKDHLEERYGLLVILLLGESVATASNALPLHGGLLASGVALAAFCAASLGWGLYFASAPRGAARLPPGPGHTLCSVTFVALHVGIIASLPLLAAGFARAVEHAAKAEAVEGEEAEGHGDDRGYGDGAGAERATTLLLALAGAIFLACSGGLVGLGVDQPVDQPVGHGDKHDGQSGQRGHGDQGDNGHGGHKGHGGHDGEVPRERRGSAAALAEETLPTLPPPPPLRRLLGVAGRARVRYSLGAGIALLAAASCAGGGAPWWPVEAWAFLVPFAMAASALLETRPAPEPVAGVGQAKHAGPGDPRASGGGGASSKTAKAEGGAKADAWGADNPMSRLSAESGAAEGSSTEMC